MARRLALVALVPALAASVSGCGLSGLPLVGHDSGHGTAGTSPTGIQEVSGVPVSRVLVRTSRGGEAVSQGAWRGEDGLFPPYADGHVMAVSFGLRNATSEPVTVLAVTEEAAGHRLLRLVGARLTPATPPDPASPVPPPSHLAPPYGKVPLIPLTIDAGGYAALQLNYGFVGCEWFPPGTTRVYGRSIRVRYRLRDGSEDEQDLEAIRVNVTSPKRCPRPRG